MTEVTKNVIEVAKNVCRTKNVTVYHSTSQYIAVYRSISQNIAVYRSISHFLAVIDPNSFGLVFTCFSILTWIQHVTPPKVMNA